MQENFTDCRIITEKLAERRIGREVSSAAPKVSVIIPAYNIAPYIKETLDSVFAQTLKDFEVVIVNDGSTDTAELKIALAPFFERIVYAEQENSGASRARNAAMCLARGELFAFLDGDDVWLPDFLESQINFLEKNNLEMIYCDALIFGERLFAGRTFTQNAPSRGAVTPESLVRAECNVITSGTVLKRHLIEKFGMFDVNLPLTQDFDLWFRLAKNRARIGYQSKILLKYRVRPNNLSGTSLNRAERSIESLKIVREKYELDAAERRAWDEQIIVFNAYLELERGKFCLTRDDFAEAKTHFANANRFYRKPKLSLINFLLRFSPRLTAHLFRKMRPSEFSFIAPGKI